MTQQDAHATPNMVINIKLRLAVKDGGRSNSFALKLLYYFEYEIVATKCVVVDFFVYREVMLRRTS